MTLQKDQDPGWWRRGMTKRGQTILIVVVVLIIVVALGFAFASGFRFF
jgi:CHASE3 domain sensor protein